MIVIVMGVVGAGKTTVGTLLAQRLSWQFADADDYHPSSNVERIRQGLPLTEEDRRPWLERLRADVLKWTAEPRNVVLACSALKRRYREALDVGPEVRFVYLKARSDLIVSRLRSRRDHFADERILASQFEDLEEPETALTVGVESPPEEIVTEIQEKLGLA
jgi:gluconokinase